MNLLRVQDPAVSCGSGLMIDILIILYIYNIYIMWHATCVTTRSSKINPSHLRQVRAEGSKAVNHFKLERLERSPASCDDLDLWQHGSGPLIFLLRHQPQPGCAVTAVTKTDSISTDFCCCLLILLLVRRNWNCHACAGFVLGEGMRHEVWKGVWRDVIPPVPSAVVWAIILSWASTIGSHFALLPPWSGWASTAFRRKARWASSCAPDLPLGQGSPTRARSFAGWGM